MLNTYQLFFSNEALRVEHFVEDLYKDLDVTPPSVSERKFKEFTLDKLDKEILYALNQDSTLPYLTIAKQLNTTIDIVRYRIKKMFENGALIKCFPEISRQKLDYSEYLCTIKLRNTSTEKLEKLKKRISNNTGISYAFFDAATLNIVFTCAFRSHDSIDHLLRHLRHDFSDIIELQDYLIIKDQIMFNLFPRGLLEE
jgi:DNA-binding Lrp family transcriptional regulator